MTIIYEFTKSSKVGYIDGVGVGGYGEKSVGGNGYVSVQYIGDMSYKGQSFH